MRKKERLGGAGDSKISSFVLLGAVLASGVGCSRFGAPVYAGSDEARIVPAAAVKRAAELPDDHDRLGRINVSCEKLDDPSDVDGEPFANVDCSQARLERALEETVAEHGGDLLVGLSCREPGDEVTCVGLAARPSNGAKGAKVAQPASPPPAPNATEAARLDEPRVLRSWAIEVSFFPAWRFVSKPLGVAEVARAKTLGVDESSLGDLESTCEREDCEQAELEWALRASAARLGARKLADVRCFEREVERVCVGTLGLPKNELLPPG